MHVRCGTFSQKTNTMWTIVFTGKCHLLDISLIFSSDTKQTSPSLCWAFSLAVCNLGLWLSYSFRLRVDIHWGSGVSKAFKKDCIVVQPFLSLLPTELHPPTPWKCGRNMLLEEFTHFVTISCCLVLLKLCWQTRKGLEKDISRMIRDLETLHT